MGINNGEFKAALRDVVSSEFLDIPKDENSINILLSKKFNQRMEKLIGLHKKAYWNYVNTSLKRLAIVCIVFFMLITTACSIKSIRIPIIKFIKNIHETFIQYFFEGDIIKEISDEYTISNLPDGFTQTEVIRTDNTTTTVYENESGERIDFVQSITKDTTHYFDIEQGVVITERYKDVSVEIYECDEFITAIWVEDGYLFELTYYGDATKILLQDIILSVR